MDVASLAGPWSEVCFVPGHAAALSARGHWGLIVGQCRSGVVMDTQRAGLSTQVDVKPVRGPVPFSIHVVILA